MIEIRKTEHFAKWIDNLKDIRGRARILARIERLASGNPGDVKAVGEGVSELRIDRSWPWLSNLLQTTRANPDYSFGWR